MTVQYQPQKSLILTETATLLMKLAWANMTENKLSRLVFVLTSSLKGTHHQQKYLFMDKTFNSPGC